MDPSKIHGDSEECSSSESGWTTYIASPDHELDEDDDGDDDEDLSVGEQENKQDVDEHVDSDDSMASDASSGPSHQHGRSLHAGNKDETKIAGKKEKKQHDEEIKAAKNKFGHKANSAGRSKKK